MVIGDFDVSRRDVMKGATAGAVTLAGVGSLPATGASAQSGGNAVAGNHGNVSASTLNLTTAERDRRWIATKAFLRKAGVDVLLCPGGSDLQAVSDLRYLAGHARNNTALLFFAESDPELITATGLDYIWLGRLSWIPTVFKNANVVDATLDRLKAKGKDLTIGVLDLNSLSKPWRDALASAHPGNPRDIGNEVRKLRVIKSDEEIALITQSAQIADAAIGQLLSRMKAGMPQQLLRAETDYSVAAAGIEETSGSFIVYPRTSVEYRPAASYLSDVPLQSGDFAMIETTPSFRGYRSQLCTHAAIGEPSKLYRSMYDVSVAARNAGLENLKPGKNLSEVIAPMRAHVEGAGFEFIGEAVGHVVGLTFSEPRIAVGTSLELRPGMALVLHAVVANSDKEEVLRADTYLVTGDGYRRLNTLDPGLFVA